MLKAVANHPLDSLAAIDLTGVDLNTRRRFIGKPIWDDFIAHRAPSLLEAARKATSEEQRISCLEAAASLLQDRADCGGGGAL